jgi:hypothetical protein
MMGVSSCVSLRQARGSCHCPACPRASGHGAMPPQTLVLPPMALEQEITPVKDKKGSKMKVLKKIKKKIGLGKGSCSFIIYLRFCEGNFYLIFNRFYDINCFV